MLRRFLVPLIFMVLASGTAHAESDRPNILWITAEDMSATLGCYGDEYAITPNIDRLAEESVRYTHAFASAPVCSPARSCLITGCYATSLGTHNMRSAFPIPESMLGFPAVLRDAGYFTTNNEKTDYNTSSWQRIVEQSWNESSDTAHWRKRSADKREQPFFSIFNLMTSHQSRSMVWPYERFVDEVQSRLAPKEIHDPAKAPLPPYYPDTPVIRRTVARFYDCVTAMDKEVGAILKQLDDDGLAEDTIVFFYSDHGSGMPRHKRALLDSGMHVPLLIRFPEKYKHLAPAEPGESTDRLVSFVDFGPTVLSLAGLNIPQFMQGRPFLGRHESQPRDYVYGHRDRVDEAIDLARSVRDRRYLYIRNYMPHLGYNQPTAWPDLGKIRHEFYRLADPEKMTGPQWHFAGPTRPREELYDCQADPQNLHNLVDSPAHRAELDRLRTAMADHRTATYDLGFIPEAEMWNRIEGGKTPIELPGKSFSKREYFELILAASQVGHSTEKQRLDYLQSETPGVRYWAAVAFSAEGLPSPESTAALKRALKDESPTVRIEAANALALHGHADAALPVLAESLKHENLAAVLHAARTIELLGEEAAPLADAMRATGKRLEGLRPEDTPATVVLPGDLDMAMFIGFSIDAFLKRVGPPADSGDTAGDWIELFNGTTLDGWTPRAEGEVDVVDGEIQILSRGKNLWLVHNRDYSDFELTVEALMPKSGYNSGIGFRCTGEGRPKGYQCEIENQKSGMIYAIGSGWVWPRGEKERAKFNEMAGDCFQVGKWNEFRIRCQGPHIEIWVNGVKTADVIDERFSSGSVALQHHGKSDVHRFRNIRLRELNEP